MYERCCIGSHQVAVVRRFPPVGFGFGTRLRARNGTPEEQGEQGDDSEDGKRTSQAVDAGVGVLVDDCLSRVAVNAGIGE